MNKVEIMGKVSHLELTYQEINGEDILILRFVVEVAKQVHDNIQNGDIVSIEGRWNVDKILTPEGEIINYCSCIPAIVMHVKNEEKNKGGMTYQ